MTRPSWDEYFMEVAEVVAKRSTCKRRQIGAILVKDKRILATGYNGAPSGLRHCEEYGCLREEMGVPSGERHEICRALHAEQNAIVQAARYGISVKDSTLYTTAEPCVLCAKMLINAGIVKIVYRDTYPDELARQMLREASIAVERYVEGSGEANDRGRTARRNDDGEASRQDEDDISAPAE